ncbi:AfsR/SARP family transcriptional regulator [Microbispora sp. NPDC046973]|uniref:AfsR/SARP family transcriptional regulator n=1 Tax=Microbispora sp. NPDC046973 TaxID=3155022 RepID=UPI0033C4BBC2
MNFAILGALEVRYPAGRIQITAPKQKSVLATLLLDADKEVPVDRLVDCVWDGRPPAAAQTTLQSYVYRLRQLLGPMPEVSLQTSTSSYAIEIGACEFDLRYFQSRVAEAHESIREGEKEQAAAAFRKALAAWRGNALVGVPGEILRQEARLLENQRIAAYEELVNLELELGNHRRVIPELHKIVSEYPFHEVFTAQLVLALYRSGRQAEALQSHSLMRRRLRDKLGIEPGIELQQLQKAILERVPAMEITLISWTH